MKSISWKNINQFFAQSPQFSFAPMVKKPFLFLQSKRIIPLYPFFFLFPFKTLLPTATAKSAHFTGAKKLFSLHLLELRYRAFYLLFSLGCTFFVGTQESTPLTHLMCTPFSSGRDECSQFIFTQVTEGFYATIEVSFICSLCFCVPLMIYHLYSFFIPSCYREERKEINSFIFLILLFFFCSLLASYTVVLPKICAFLRQFEFEGRSMEIRLEARIAPAIRWSCTTFLITAAFFQVPILFTLLLRWGVIKESFLREKRKYVLFSLLLILSLLSPPDVTSQCVLAIMGCIVYELLFWFALFYHKLIARRASNAKQKEQ